MTNLAIAYTRQKLVSRDTAIKWSALASLAFVNYLWMAEAGFRIGPGYVQTFGAVLILACVGMFYYYTGRDQRIFEFAHFGAQILSLYALLMMSSYMAFSTNAPLVDDVFDAIDKSAGLNWVTWTRWVQAHPYVQWVLLIAYNSLPVQALVCYVYNSHTSEFRRNNEIWYITFIAGLLTIAGSAALPATNPYVYYGFEAPEHFVHMLHFLGLRDGTMRVINFTDAQGLIQLPSFHTVLAIMMTYNLRRNRLLFAIALVLSTLLILSCPTEGSHYFIDMLAGAAIVVITICFVRHMGIR